VPVQYNRRLHKCEHSVVAMFCLQASEKTTKTPLLFEISVYSVSDALFLLSDKLYGLALLCYA